MKLSEQIKDTLDNCGLLVGNLRGEDKKIAIKFIEILDVILSKAREQEEEKDIIHKLIENGYTRIRISKCDPYGYYISFRKYKYYPNGVKEEIETKVFNDTSLGGLYKKVYEFIYPMITGVWSNNPFSNCPQFLGWLKGDKNKS